MVPTAPLPASADSWGQRLHRLTLGFLHSNRFFSPSTGSPDDSHTPPSRLHESLVKWQQEGHRCLRHPQHHILVAKLNEELMR